MFRVENADFIADKLASELLPNQEFREVVKNAEEAIRRRISDDPSGTGRVELDVDWPLLALSDAWYVCCSDDGDGMSRSELERYTTTLAVRGAGNSQSLTGNQGMGLKISGPTRHKRGVLIRSMKTGERTMVQIGWNGSEYGLIPLGPNGEVVVSVGEDYFPRYILERGSGTVVTFLGNVDQDNTFVPADRPRGWLFRYLNQRFASLSNDAVSVFVRVPSGTEDEWPRSREEADLRQRKQGGRSFNLSAVYGTASVWNEAADKQGPGHRGQVDLAGDPAQGVPSARMHWWVLPTSGSDVSSRTFGGGTIAVLYNNELYDWRTSSQANPLFARLGVLFGKTRIAFMLEPLGSTISDDFARAHVLVGGKSALDSDTWLIWADQFRAQIPDAIQQAMLDEQAKLQTEDPDRAKRIRDRLKDVMSLLRPRRFRRNADGAVNAAGPSATGSGDGAGGAVERVPGTGRRQPGSSARGIGALLTQLDDEAGEPANEVFTILRLDPRWISEREAEDFPIVNGNGKGLHDRAAALAGEDGVSAGILLLNRDFRGYQAILAAINEWANPDGDSDKATLIERYAQEWIEQKMIEAVHGLRQLENGSTWLVTHFDDALSPVALTAAFMADRYHTLREVKRQVGSVRTIEPKG